MSVNVVTSAANPIVAALLADGRGALAVVGVALFRLAGIAVVFFVAWRMFGGWDTVGELTGFRPRFEWRRPPRRARKYGLFMKVDRVARGNPFSGVVGGREAATVAAPVASFGVAPDGHFLDPELLPFARGSWGEWAVAADDDAEGFPEFGEYAGGSWDHRMVQAEMDAEARLQSQSGADMGLPGSDAPGAPAWSFVQGPFGGSAVPGVNYGALSGESDSLEFQDARLMDSE